MNMRVLYVDDEPDLREVAVMSLELDPDLEVRACGSGAEALVLLESWEPDLILLDLMMPQMDGPSTHRAIVERFGDRFPIVYFTARAEEKEKERLIGLGALGVIAKPFDPMNLASQVRAHVERA
ncbi:response regulator [Novosphingobium profundi]|uniref:response regulator n=1 Tax=Novosphingobium profundi TaxID=1774954 RepID=UPI001BDA0D1D|nr:response regulator [Novosphingobium profundi]MBT0668020.1 response regulator [Novosphingobium profundi]